ncbi:MAG TPA: transcriptional regulator [Ruminococcaceae bacterium]|nr:transcriptional regulator [Oscillospiraceae bacterium]HCA30349.1 transcriptional regulator [Oscillospiraceae bacterium]
MMKKLKHKPYTQFKSMLHERKIGYGELSNLLGVSVSAVGRKVNGRSDFLISEIARIEMAYRIPKSVFLPK